MLTRRSRRPDPSQSLKSIESGQKPGDSGVGGAYPEPDAAGRMTSLSGHRQAPSGSGSTYWPNAIVGSAAVPSHVALKAWVLPGVRWTPHVSFAGSKRQPPRPRSSVDPPFRSTARSAIPSLSMSSGYAPVAAVRSVVGDATRVNRSAPPVGLSFR